MFCIVSDFFTNLFRYSSLSPADIRRASRNIRSRLEGTSTDGLRTKFTAKEIKNAVFDLGPTKALGPDEYQVIFFFQKDWGIVGYDVTKVCMDILNGGKDVKEFNDTNVILIPKMKNHVNIQDFRLIYLCSVIYKIITKVLASHLKRLLPQLISPSQSAFIPRRQIFDNILVAFEVLHSIGRKKAEKHGHMALKLDMRKMYDCVEWPFLLAIMKKIWFLEKWTNLVMDCIS